MNFIRLFLLFGWNQALSCIFPAVIFITLALSKFIAIPFLGRYDVILLVCILAQILLVYFKLETIDELKVITMFHVIGLILELYKVHMGSWSYPEEAWTKVWGVPLYSGFMYASVASYICQAWRRFDIEFVHWPKAYLSILVACVIYLNFFTHHYMYDLRWWIIASLLIVFYRTHVNFTVSTTRLRMPILMSFFLVGFFIWIAENISTFLGAWRYPNQQITWQVVHFGKISSWFLLVIISFIIVTQLKHYKYKSK